MVTGFVCYNADYRPFRLVRITEIAFLHNPYETLAACSLISVGTSLTLVGTEHNGTSICGILYKHTRRLPASCWGWRLPCWWRFLGLSLIIHWQRLSRCLLPSRRHPCPMPVMRPTMSRSGSTRLILR